MTLIDRIDAFAKNYIYRTPKDTIKEEPFKPSQYSQTLRKYSRENLTPEKRRKLALQAPLYMKGLEKKSADTFRAWFTLEKFKTRKPPIAIDETIIRLFDKRAKTKKKFKIGDKSSHIYGDGFILIRYQNDNKSGKKGSTDLSLPPYVIDDEGNKKYFRPYDLQVLDAECLTELKYKNKEWEGLGIQHFYYKSKSGKEVWIHPDRILHIKRNELPFSKFGIADTDALLDVLQAYPDIVISTGEILKWFSHGITYVTKQNMSPNERKAILEELAKHPNIYANDDRYKMDVITPQAISPKEFFDFIIQNIAGILGMPAHMLVGLVIGRVTGAESMYTDYYKDVRDDQDMIYTPLTEKLYGQLLNSYGRDFFIYETEWNQIYINEMAEAELLDKKADAVKKFKEANMIDQKEGRQIINKGIVELDVDKKIKQEKWQKSPLPNPFPKKPKNPNDKE